MSDMKQPSDWLMCPFQADATNQLLDKMSRKQSDLEGRLDDLLSRIATETEEIKELEQQLTDGEETSDESSPLIGCYTEQVMN